MERIFWMLIFIVISIVVIVSIYILLPKFFSGNNTGEELNIACLRLIQNNCDDSAVLINSKNFEKICKDNGMNLDECKQYCGCKQ